jgi:hypothetical protein
MVAALIPHAAKQPQGCEEIFTLSHQLFKKLAETSNDFFNLDELISQWSALLLSHAPNEVYSSSLEVSVCAKNSAERRPS